MRRADELTHEQLVAMVNGIQAILWRNGDEWDADKAWDAETVEHVAGVLEHAGLRPVSADREVSPAAAATATTRTTSIATGIRWPSGATTARAARPSSAPPASPSP
jgi:hypothetical protein